MARSGCCYFPSEQHNLLKNTEKFLSKFNPDNNDLPEDHIKHFMLAMGFKNVHHQDVLCRLFTIILKGKPLRGIFLSIRGPQLIGMNLK